MSWRTIVITKRAKLDLQLGFMVVRGEDTTKVALNEIAVVLIESTAVSLTTSLLAELMKRKVKVIFYLKKSKNRIIRINTGILSNMKQKIKEFYH